MKVEKYYCDRCLKEISGKKANAIKYSREYPGDLYLPEKADLCDVCFDKFLNDFLTEEKIKMMAEQEPDQQPCPPMPKGADE